MDCGGNCAACSGCGRALTLSGPELEVLERLAQTPFLPAARTAQDPAPLDPEAAAPLDSRAVLQALERKGLIQVDFDAPLAGTPEAVYGPYPIRGSMALTQRGQQVLELLEYQGIQED